MLPLEIGHILMLEFSSHVLKNANDAYTTLSQNLIGCSTFIQMRCNWLILQSDEKATLKIFLSVIAHV